MPKVEEKRLVEPALWLWGHPEAYDAQMIHASLILSKAGYANLLSKCHGNQDKARQVISSYLTQLFKTLDPDADSYNQDVAERLTKAVQ